MNDTIANLPTPIKIGGVVVAVGGVLGAAYTVLHDWTFFTIIACGILLLLLGYLAWKYYGKKQGRKKVGAIFGESQSGELEGDDSVNIEALHAEFTQGFVTWLKKAKNPEKTPWYVVVGESNAGKSWAIAHSQLRFILNRGESKDNMNFVGGPGPTMGMKWWFTQEAVILDTAGRLMLPPDQTRASAAWRGFLEILKTHRRNCPINGLFLMISSESLLEYTPEQISEKAGVIGQRFEEIQDELGVRFPVFVFITKCDLINGFNEFFEDLTDPRWQNQILGWSNPEGLDEDFDSGQVNTYLEKIRQRLLRRRADLLLKPPPSADPHATRLDQVDALYNLPDKITKIGSRLSLYLDAIFKGNSNKDHLFLRGIYFTCARQLGVPIDDDLAKALNIPVSQLPKDRAMERKRSFFLRDVFMEKAFREKGLVTRADNVSADKTRKRALVLGTAIVVVLLLIGVAWFNATQFQNVVVQQTSFFKGLSRPDNLKFDQMAIVTPPPTPPTPSMTINYQDFIVKIDPNDNKDLALAPMLSQSIEEAKIAVSPPLMLKPTALLNPNLNAKVRETHRLLFEALVLKPLITATRAKISVLSSDMWYDDATDGLIELLRIERSPPNAPPRNTLDFDALFRCNLETDRLKVLKQDKTVYDQNDSGHKKTQFDAIFDWTYSPNGGKAPWPAACLEVGQNTSVAVINSGVESFVGYVEKHKAESDRKIKAIAQLSNALQTQKNAEELLITCSKNVSSEELYNNWMTAAANVITAGKAVDAAWKVALDNDWDGKSAITDFYRRLIEQRQNKAKKDLKKLLDEIPEYDAFSSARKTVVDSISQTEEAKKNADTDQLASTLQTQNVDYLMIGTGPDDSAIPRYKIHCQTLVGVTDRFKEKTSPKSSLNDGFKALDAEFHDLRTSLEHCEAQNSDARLTQIDTACRSAMKGYVEPRESSLLVDAALNKLKQRPEDWESYARSMFPILSTLPEVPLTAAAASPTPKYDSRYAPECVSAVQREFDALDLVFGETVSSESRRNVLDPGRFKDTVAARRAAWQIYQARYVAYWSRDVFRVLEPSDGERGKSWDKLRSDLRQLEVELCHEKLEKLGRQAQEALKLVPAGSDATGTKAKLNDGLERLTNKTFVDRCRNTVQKWSELSDDPLTARRTILTAKRPISDYTFQAYAKGEAPDFTIVYWNYVTDLVLDALHQSVSAEAAQLANELKSLRQFPLELPTALKDSDLKPADLARARELLKKLGDGGDLGQSDPADDGTDPLKKLRTTGVDQDAAWLKTAETVLNTLPDPGQTIHFSLKLVESTGAMLNNCDSLRISQDGKVLGGVGQNIRQARLDEKGNLNNPVPFGGYLNMPGGPIVMEVGSGFNAGAQVKATGTFGDANHAQWCVLRLIFNSSEMRFHPPNQWELTFRGKINIRPPGAIVDLKPGAIVLLLTQEDDKANRNPPGAVIPGDYWRPLVAPTGPLH